MKKKMNIGLSLAQNYNKVTLDFLDELIEFETEEELKKEIQMRFSILNEQISRQFAEIKRGKE